MKKLILLAVMLGVFALAFAQPQPGDTTGIVSGAPTGFGGILLWAANLLSGAFLTYWATKLATRFPFIKGGITVALGSGLGMACVGLVSFLAAKLGFPTGLSVAWGGLGSFVVASAAHEYFQNKPPAPPTT